MSNAAIGKAGPSDRSLFTLGGLDVTIDGLTATELVLLQDGRLQVTVPAGATTGAVDLLVVAGDELAYAPNSYSYNPLPSITTVVPNEGYIPALRSPSSARGSQILKPVRQR
ncbi:MAG: hypothetical protein GY811_20425 [Myxococcales bacterium]|nr:hypothetical protein [Myxococcales bacterium]